MYMLQIFVVSGNVLAVEAPDEVMSASTLQEHARIRQLRRKLSSTWPGTCAQWLIQTLLVGLTLWLLVYSR